MNDYTGPSVGFTNEELKEALGRLILDFFDEQELKIVWKRK